MRDTQPKGTHFQRSGYEHLIIAVKNMLKGSDSQTSLLKSLDSIGLANSGFQVFL